MNESDNAKIFFKGKTGFERVAVPAYERIKHLYALGYSVNQICLTVNNEFRDLCVEEMDNSRITSIISNNREDFDANRMLLASRHRETYSNHSISLFNLTQSVELRVVNEYNIKIQEALDELSLLSLSEVDADGNFKNSARIFILMEFIEKFHKKCSEFIGTTAMRDIQAYKQKMEIKHKAESGSGLIPTFEVNGGNSLTKFHE